MKLLLLALPLTSATILSGFDHLANPAPHAEEGAVAVSVNCTFIESNSEDHFAEAHAYPYGVGVCTEEGKASFQVGALPAAWCTPRRGDTCNFSLSKLHVPSFQVNFADAGQTSYFEPGETIDIDIVRRRWSRTS